MNLKIFLALVESPRKRRLAACAFARSVWPILVDPRSRKAVEVAERSADGLATDKQLQEAWGIVRLEQCSEYRGVDIAALASRAYSGNPIAWKNQLVQWLDNTPQCPHEQILDDLAGPTRECPGCNVHDGWNPSLLCQTCSGSGRVLQPQTLCGGETHNAMKNYPEKYGIGYSSNVSCDDCNRILAWNDATVPRVASAIYRDRDFDRMSILADALEEASTPSTVKCKRCGGKSLIMAQASGQNIAVDICSDCKDGKVANPIIQHCRQERKTIFCGNKGSHNHRGKAGLVLHGVLHESDPTKAHHHHDEKCERIEAGIHARGCWVLDLILGKC